MCTTIQYHDGDCFPAWEADTRAALAARCPRGVLISPNHKHQTIDGACLCGVDIGATAKRNGYHATWDVSSWMFKGGKEWPFNAVQPQRATASGELSPQELEALGQLRIFD